MYMGMKALIFGEDFTDSSVKSIFLKVTNDVFADAHSQLTP